MDTGTQPISVTMEVQCAKTFSGKENISEDLIFNSEISSKAGSHSIVDVNWLLSGILSTLFSRICITLHEVSFKNLLYCRNQSREHTT